MELIKPLNLVPKNKKGMGIGDIYPSILIIGLVAILLGVVLFVLDEFADNMPLRGVTVTNASFNYVSIEVNQTIDNVGQCNFQNFGVTSAWILSSGVAINSSCYVVYPDVGNIASLACDSGTTNGTYMNLTYTYLWGGQACESTEDLIDEIADFVPWIGIILLVIAAAIVLGLLIRNLAGGQRV